MPLQKSSDALIILVASSYYIALYSYDSDYFNIPSILLGSHPYSLLPFEIASPA